MLDTFLIKSALGKILMLPYQIMTFLNSMDPPLNTGVISMWMVIVMRALSDITPHIVSENILLTQVGV